MRVASQPSATTGTNYPDTEIVHCETPQERRASNNIFNARRKDECTGDAPLPCAAPRGLLRNGGAAMHRARDAACRSWMLNGHHALRERRSTFAIVEYEQTFDPAHFVTPSVRMWQAGRNVR
jgi:hypothetical protein